MYVFVYLLLINKVQLIYNLHLSLKFNRPQWEPISEAAKDLICKMLCLDPKKRLTIQEVLNHRWLRASVVCTCVLLLI